MAVAVIEQVVTENQLWKEAVASLVGRKCTNWYNLLNENLFANWRSITNTRIGTYNSEALQKAIMGFPCVQVLKQMAKEMPNNEGCLFIDERELAYKVVSGVDRCVVFGYLEVPDDSPLRGKEFIVRENSDTFLVLGYY